MASSFVSGDDDDDDEKEGGGVNGVALSISSLHNNIGVLMLMMGSIDEATERFYLAIDSSSSVLKTAEACDDENDNTDPPTIATIPTTCHRLPKQQQRQSSAISYDGLVWFYQRLCRQVFGGSTLTEGGHPYHIHKHHTIKPITDSVCTISTPCSPSCRSVSASSCFNMVHTSKRWTTPFVYHQHHQHQNHHPSIVSPNNHYYSSTANHYNPPLGLEYVFEPIMVGPTAKDGQIAAYLNLAYIHLITHGQEEEEEEQNPSQDNTSKMFRTTKKDASYEQTTLHLLQRAATLCCCINPCSSSASSNSHNSHPYDPSSIDNSISLLLTIVTHLNRGVLYFSLGQVQDAFVEFQLALDCFLGTTKTAYNPSRFQQKVGMILIYEYLHITTLCNLIRTFIRINQIHKAMELCQELIMIHIPNLPSSSSHSYTSNSNCYWSTILFPSYTHLPHKCKWIIQHVAKFYFQALIQHKLEHWSVALESMNYFLSMSRIEYGHSHVYIAVILERKAAILFDQRNLHCAMLSYLASLRVYESFMKILPSQHPQQDHFVVHGCKEKRSYPQEIFQVERARLLYAIGRTLHDREEYIDALSMYNKALEVQRDIVQKYNTRTRQHQKNACVDVITTLCNVGRIHHLLGDLDKALRVNNEVVTLAIEMVAMNHDTIMENMTSNPELTSVPSTTPQPPPPPPPESHDFVRNRMISLGNLYVEAGRLEDAMIIFTRIARSQGLESFLSYRPEGSDIDTSAFAVKAAERLGKIGLQIPHAAAA